MALPELRGTGRILTDPRQGVGKNDTPWCSALIKFPVWKKTDDGWKEQPDSPVASVITFDDNATLLAGFTKGDEVGVHGTVKPAVYKDTAQLAIVASQVWATEKQARPAASKQANITGTQTLLAEARTAATASRRQLDDRLSARRTESAA